MAAGVRFERLFDAPLPNPNGLQAAPGGLWIADQITDQVFFVDLRTGGVLQSLETEGENLSGITFGDGALWLASNGKPVSRPSKPTDKGTTRIIRADPMTGRTLAEYPLAGGGGVHGIEWSHEGLWLTTLARQTLSLVDPRSFEVKRSIPVPEKRAHGLACDGGAIWCVHTAHRMIVKLDAGGGTELDRIVVPEAAFEPHGLTIVAGDLWSCDALTGGIFRIIRAPAEPLRA